MMNREDIFRELELLPVWQLRYPVAESHPSETKQSLTVAPEVVNNQTEAEIGSLTSFRVIISDDGQWLFALSQQHSSDAETLFHNMMKAINVNIGQDIAEAKLQSISDYAPKIIVAMGEAVAHQLLALSHPLAQMRSQSYILNNTPMIVSYAPNDLVQNPADKAKAWQDLCLAKTTMISL